MNLTSIAIGGLIALLILMVIGMNVGMSLLIVGIVGYTLIAGFRGTIGLLGQAPGAQASDYSLCVVPLFILMGNLCFASGMSDSLFDFADKWLAKLPGGVACAAIAACAGFGAICGSTAATAATMGVVAIPTMRKYGYDDALSTGCVSVGGTLGIMIPPSTAFIVYGIMAEESIGRLFASGVFPGILLAVLCCAVVVIQVKLNPSLAPATDRKITWKVRIAAIKGLLWVAILFIVVLGGMFSGIFTINEAAAFGAFGGFIIMIINKKMTRKVLAKVLLDTTKTTAMTFVILIGASIFGKFLAITQLPTALAATILGLDVSRYVILTIIIIIYAIMGCFMDALPMITITVPIFLPIMKSLGFDPIWFGVIIVFVSELGLISPPVGLNCYVIAGVAKDVPLSRIFRGSIPFVPAIIAAIIIATVFPSIATWLPTMIYG